MASAVTRACRPRRAGHRHVLATPDGGARSFVEQMRRDVQAVKERDPAATSTFEVVTSYSGLHALWFHRVAHKLTAAACRCCRAGSASSAAC